MMPPTIWTSLHSTGLPRRTYVLPSRRRMAGVSRNRSTAGIRLRLRLSVCPLFRTTPLALREFRTARRIDSVPTSRTLIGPWTPNSRIGTASSYCPPITFSSNPIDRHRLRAAVRRLQTNASRLEAIRILRGRFYKKLFLKTQYTRDIGEYNRLHGTDYHDYADIHFPETLPDERHWKEDWEQFVRHTLNLLWIRVSSEAVTDYRAYLSRDTRHRFA